MSVYSLATALSWTHTIKNILHKNNFTQYDGFVILTFKIPFQYQMLPSGEKERSGSSLILQNASRLDSGTYICAASNGVETTVDAKIKLRVICKLSFRKLTQRIHIPLTFSFICKLSSRWAWNSSWQSLGPFARWYWVRDILHCTFKPGGIGKS